ncbi:MAG: Rieske 2Fe-2S domain-containing protein [Kofleriaceae bacterium]
MIATAALIADLCGPDPADVYDGGLGVAPRPVAGRPTVSEALRQARPGSVVAARDGVRPVALVVLADQRAYAVDDACPHDGGWLSDGFLDGDRLVCARHGWEIDPCSGTCGRVPVASRRIV